MWNSESEAQIDGIRLDDYIHSWICMRILWTSLSEDLYDLMPTKALMKRDTAIVQRNKRDEIGGKRLVSFISNLKIVNDPSSPI